ncbi:hypothetical protein P4H27_10040 [Paenibacillus taichungensis]|uniref:DUF2577 family protein n=1 Tax=Paenibacillus taichungensis TaxID=484184 RepID=UPI002DBC2BA0|nr:DUF2577 family protein [Paenibacillus taichungensis]MEC0107276.1 hypothetical protein [Paenibacillus taichungensis]MEC0194792.1 hypothetical protein [Paenibacillus taichungensis]
MDKWDVQLANIFKERNNPAQLGTMLGKVNSPMPNLSLSLGDEIVLDTEDLVLANKMFYLPAPLIPGDYVIVSPSADGQTYFVMDKAGE